MARGWESKAVEAQIEEGNQRIQDQKNFNTSPDVRSRQQRLESLRLSRSRLLEQLDRARYAAHRSILLNGLKAIEREIENTSPVSELDS